MGKPPRFSDAFIIHAAAEKASRFQKIFIRAKKFEGYFESVRLRLSRYFSRKSLKVLDMGREDILAGVFFLNQGYSLRRTCKQPATKGGVLPVIMVVLLVSAPSFIHFTEAGGGPGALHAAVWVSPAAGVAVGAPAQRTRLCMVGGVQGLVLFREPKLILSFAEQPVAHNFGLASRQQIPLTPKESPLSLALLWYL